MVTDFAIHDRMDLRPLFGPLRRSLVELLAGAASDDWNRPTACEGWSVHDVASHLLGVDLGNVSRRRDGHKIDPAPGEEFGTWLAVFNEEWVSACRRLSAPALLALLDVAGRWFDAYLADLDLNALGPPIWWVGPASAPVWLDVAREYTERWVHQQQVRDALGVPGMTDEQYLHPVLATFAHALPNALRQLDRPDGSTVELVATGDGGGTWHVSRTAGDWTLRTGSANAEPECRVVGSASDVWRLYADYGDVRLSAEGDRELAAAVVGGRAVITARVIDR